MSHYSKNQIDKLLKSKTHYETLGLHASASQKQIKQAFKQRALRYHPDKTSIPQAKELFGKVASAYEKLSDSEEKAKYDASLFRQKSTGFSANSFKKEQSAHQKYKSYQKREFKNNFTSFRQQSKQKYDKYFKPPPKTYIPKRPQPSHKQYNQEETTYSQQQQKKYKYRPKNNIKSNTNYGTILLTLLCFMLFWNFLPNFSSQPRYQFVPVGPYSYEMKTARYKVKYWMKVEDVNKTQISQTKLQQNYISLLQKTCENNMNMKQKVEQMKVGDPLNKKLWQQKQRMIDYKACKRLLKLLKKYPEIKLTKFPNRNIT